MQHPKLILCDEPIASLDPKSSKVIMDHLKAINQNQKITCLVNLHQVDVAMKYSERIIGVTARPHRLRRPHGEPHAGRHP